MGAGALPALALAAAISVQADPWQVTFTQRGGPPLVTRGPVVDGARAVRATSVTRDGAAYVAELALDDGRTATVRVTNAARRSLRPGCAARTGEAFAAADDERLYGTGERSDALSRNGLETLNYVADGPFREEDRQYVKAF